MKTCIKKQILNSSTLDKDHIEKILIKSGFSIDNIDILTFKESHNFSTHSGKNRLMIFKPLLNGQIRIDHTTSQLVFTININGIIFKTILLGILVSFMMFYFIDKSFLSSLIIGGCLGGLIFLINNINLNYRIDFLTSKINKKQTTKR
nr:hypothetical protein [uncultured Draconibacterium sp.]